MTIKDSDAASISDLVYHNPRPNSANQGYKTDYNFIDSSGSKDSAEGFFAAAFKKDNVVIVAIRGTNSFSDNGESAFKKVKQFARDMDDNINFKTGNPMPQYEEALAFTQRIHKQYGNSVIVTGHSLGGGLAQLVGIKLGLMVISFDSPGVYKIAKNLFTRRDEINAHKNNIIIYATAPHLINTMGQQIVDPIQIKVKAKFSCKHDVNLLKHILKVLEYTYLSSISHSFYYTQYLRYSFDQHAIKGMAEAFDPITGKPYSAVNYDKWPNYIQSYRGFLSKCDLANEPKNPTSLSDNPIDNMLNSKVYIEEYTEKHLKTKLEEEVIVNKIDSNVELVKCLYPTSIHNRLKQVCHQPLSTITFEQQIEITERKNKMELFLENDNFVRNFIETNSDIYCKKGFAKLLHLEQIQLLQPGMFQLHAGATCAAQERSCIEYEDTKICQPVSFIHPGCMHKQCDNILNWVDDWSEL